MPEHPIGLSIQSSRDERNTAVSECIAREVAAGVPQEQAVAICTSKADRAQGTRELR